MHIVVALVALKARHNLSNSCIEDILALFRLIGFDAPSSYKALRTTLRKRSATHLTPLKCTICPHCEQSSTRDTMCTVCGARYAPLLPSSISSFYTYSIVQQLEAVLSTSRDLKLARRSAYDDALTDITDGHVYRRLIRHEPESVITLTMNVDGIQPNKGSDQSLWPILLAVNEIHRKKRFSLENVIIAGMWPGPSKPSRHQMALLFEGVVSELRDLEDGRPFHLYSALDDDYSQVLKVFLIASCCDKPAQCLIQYLSEPTAMFGCGNCEVQGKLEQWAHR